MSATGPADDAGPWNWSHESADVVVGKKIIAFPNEKDRWNYLSKGNEQQWRTEQGMRTTKFHNGFQRRREGSIGQDQERKAFEAYRENRAQSVSQLRRTRLNELNKYNGYNIVTGEMYSDRGKPVDRKQRKHYAGGTSEFVKREGDVVLRASNSRFHRPQIITTEARTKRIKKEGLVTTAKHSSLLGTGRDDMPSYGAADCFQYAQYEPWQQQQQQQGGAGAGGSIAQQAGMMAMSAQASAVASAVNAAYGPGSSRAAKPPRDPDLAPKVGNGTTSRSSIRSAGQQSVSSRRPFRAASRSSRPATSHSAHSAAAKRAAEIQQVRSLPQ